MKFYFRHIQIFYGLLGRNLYFTIILSMLVTILDSIGIGFFVLIVQSIIEGSDGLMNYSPIRMLNSWGLISNHPAGLLVLGGAAFIIKAILFYLQLRIQAKNTNVIITKNKLIIQDKLVHLDYGKFMEMNFGNIQNVSTLEILKLNSALVSYLSAVQYLIMAITYLIISFYSNVTISIIIIFTAGLFGLIYYKISNYFKRVSSEISSAGDVYNSLLNQMLNNYKYLKLTNAIQDFSAKVKQAIYDAESRNFKLLNINAKMLSLREPIILTVLIIILFVYQSIGKSITGSAIFSLLIFYRTLNYIMIAQNGFQNFSFYQGSIDNITLLQQRMGDAQEFTQGSKTFSLEKQIEVNNLTVSLNKREVLNNINLVIPKNTSAGIVGMTGSGKTTLINMISGLIKPNSGTIKFDGVNIADMNLANMRSRIGYVTQEPVIFNDTYFNNITLWAEKNKENLTRFHEVAAISHLSHLIERAADAEDSLLGENGMMLSGGQRQRVAIARELFKRPEILILDEATASLDTATENIIRDNINSLHGKTTLIVVAHRLSTVMTMDQIYVMSKGQIVDSGSYSELSEDSVYFQQLMQQNF